MKKLATTILAVSVLASSPLLAQMKKGDAPSAAITQDKAQALAVQKYPGAKVINCKMDTVKGTSVWVVTFNRTGANLSEKVSVDAQTGKVTKM